MGSFWLWYWITGGDVLTIVRFSAIVIGVMGLVGAAGLLIDYLITKR